MFWIYHINSIKHNNDNVHCNIQHSKSKYIQAVQE